MKRILLLILAGLVAVSCNDDEKIIGSERTFTVKSTTSDWPRNTYGAISRTYEVVTAGASGGWTARLLDGQQGFVLETDEAANTFTVSIGENTGMVNLEDKVCVTYGGEMIYLSLLQISNYFSVSPGKDVGGGIYKYTVGDDGISTYTGTIVNPGTGSVSVTWVSGSEVFTPVLSPAEKPTSLSFTAPANVTFFPNEALFAVAVSDKPDQTVQIAVYQPGLQVPMGALPETEAPGGYYYPLVCGIDVAGVNIPVDPNATWNDVFDPDLTLEQNGTSKNQTAPVNPCPEGWNAPTEAQMKRIMVPIRASRFRVRAVRPKWARGIMLISCAACARRNNVKRCCESEYCCFGRSASCLRFRRRARDSRWSVGAVPHRCAMSAENRS